MAKIFENGENIYKWLKYLKMAKIFKNDENI